MTATHLRASAPAGRRGTRSSASRGKARAAELEKYREESKGLAKSEEDVLSYALFPQVAAKFLEARDNPVPAEAPAPAASDDNSVRTIYVQDLSE